MLRKPMINRLKALLAERSVPAGATHTVDQLHLAAAALLVEAARMDDRVDANELTRIRELVEWRFGLNEEEAAELVAEAEKATADAVELYRFTRVVRDAFAHDERVQLVEMLWDVACADGEVHELEASLLRRICGLLNVSDRESGHARKRAVSRHGHDAARGG